jgi:hypothetical protein
VARYSRHRTHHDSCIYPTRPAFLHAEVFKLGAYPVGACVAELFKYAQRQLPGLPGCISRALGSLGLPELYKDIGFSPVVSNFAEDSLREPVLIDGTADVPLITVGVSEMFNGVGRLPPAVSLVEDNQRPLVQVDGGVKGSQLLVNSAEPGKAETLGPGIRGLAGSYERLLDAAKGFAGPLEVQVGDSFHVSCSPLAPRVTGFGGYCQGALAELCRLNWTVDVQMGLGEAEQDPCFCIAIT